MEDEQHTIRYGDNIILRCMGDNKIYYLLARNEQYLMETKLEINNSCTFNMYNFPQHMVFTIFPKQNYSMKDQNKFNSDKSFGTSFDVQKQLIYTRMETEKKYNQNLLKQTKGQKVMYGDTIMLYQSLSQVFLLRDENNNSNSNIGTNLSSSMYFKVDPDPLALDIKQGSPVHSYDQFLLVQNDTILKFDTIQEIERLPEILKSSNLDHKPEFFTIPAIIENEYQFKFYRPQYKQFATDTREQTSHNTLQAIVLSQQKDINHLHYGQYVRILHMQQNIKKKGQDQKRRSIKVEEHQEHQINKGYLISTINAIGCYPSVFLQINDNQNNDTLEKASSIFQIVPETDQKYSEEIQFHVGNKPNLVGYTSFLLRHLLTGEYLRVNPNDNKLQLSKEIINKYRQMGSSSTKKLNTKQNEQAKSVASKNQPGIKLYRNLINQNCNQQNNLQIQQEQHINTQFQQNQKNQDEIENNFKLEDHQLLFVTKLGNNPIFYKDQLPFTIDTTFNIATKDGKCPIEVDSQEEGLYQVKLITKLGMFNQYGEENVEQMLYRQLHEEWLQMIPELDQYSKKNKQQQQFSQSDKEVLEFIEMEKKIQAKNKVDMRHYKADDETFKPTFINLNPLNTKYLDVLSSEDFSGSNFKFEKVNQSEIEELNELLGLLYPLISLAKNSIQLSTLKFKFSNPKFKESQQSKDLSSQFLRFQAQAIQNVNQAVKSLIKLMLWLKAINESLAQENIIAEPINRRQCMAREIGCIDYVNKIIYELNINELLYENQDQILQDEDMFSLEINSLIDALSSFLQLVCHNSNENSIYVVQWYYLYKHILLKGQVNDQMRLDILITQLFQQSDVMVSFEFEVTQLSKETKFTNYNKHAFNLLIAFCLFTEFRKKEGIEAIIEYIFQENKDSIFSKIVFDGNIQLMLKERAFDLQKTIRQSIDSGVQNSSPFMIEGFNFPSKSALNDYIISCVRLASEIAKSSPALTIQQIKDLFPFKTVTQIIQDIQISSQIKSYFLELFQNSYMAKHFKPLPRIQFPQYLKMVVRQDIGKGFLGFFKKEESSIVLFAFAQKKISNIYKKVQQKYLVQGDESIDFWLILSQFITHFWKTKTIYEIKEADHIYIKQLIITFSEFLSKGLLIEYLQDAHNFYDMYHKFIEFLKNSVVSATLEEKYIRHQFQENKKSSEQKQQDSKDYYLDNTVSQRKFARTTYAKSMIWLDELIEILIQLEQFQQSRMADQFITSEDNYVIFDDLLYLQKFAKDKKYAEVVQRLRQAKRASYHTRAKQQQQSHLDHKDMFTTQELTNILRECSYARKTTILEYMGGIKQLDISLVYFLIELLTLNQIRLSAKVTEFLWLIYSSRSNFLYTLNQTILIETFDQGDLQLSVNQNIFIDFSNIYWKLHFAFIDLIQSLERDSTKCYETINDALSDMLVIFFPDYAAKSDMQMYMEIVQLENEEKHYQAQEEKIIKNKAQQEVAPVDQNLSHPDLDLIDQQSQHNPIKEQQLSHQFQSQKSATMDSNQKFIWKINNSFSLDIITIYQRQKLLRYLGFHELIKKLIENLISDTSTLFREKDVLVSNTNKKGWEIKSEILEKSILILIYFVIRNEENQELLLNLGKNKNQFLYEMSNVKRKQLQTLIYILFVELFRDNYTILFSLEKYNDENSILAKLFSIFGNNFQHKNYEACIYFLQFLQTLLKVKENDVVQNNYVIIQLFMNTQQLNTFAKDIGLLMTTIQLMRLEQFYTSTNAFGNQQNLNNQKSIRFDGFIEMPIEILFFIELIRLLRMICSKRSQLVNDFIKKIFPLQRMSEMIKYIDEWYPLKYELLLYFQRVFLDNLQYLNFEEKQELVKTITDTILKQIIVSFVENKNIKKFAEAKLINSIVFNIFGIRNQYSNQELIMSVQYEKSSFIYLIFGVLDVIKQFIKKLYPKYFQLDEQEYFDDSIQNDIIYNAQNIFDDILRAQDFTQDGYINPGKMRSSIYKRKSGQKVTKLFNLTHRLLSSHQDEQDQELSFIAKEEDEQDKDIIIKIVEATNSFQQSDLAFQLLRNDLQINDQIILDKWSNSIKSQRTKLIDEHLIASERENEIQQLVNLIITLKRDDTEKFKRMITALTQMLSESSVSPSIKLKSINIVRKLSNYKEDTQISKSILKDLGQLGFTDFLCDLIKQENDQEQKLEYIKAFVDYIDDSSREIQNSFLLYLQRDKYNTFIISLQSFITEMFQDVRMTEISKIERNNKNINKILNNKINGCILIFELFRLGCEDHFTEMQNFLRHQVNSKQPINFIMFTAQLFEKYVEIMNEHNVALGQKLLDFLIECVQGPCLENQMELCQSTKILEVLEQIILQQRIDQERFQRKDIVFSSLRSKVFLLQLSLMEGNNDQEIARKISQYFNPQLLFERIQLIYWKIIKKIRNTQMQINLEVKILDRAKSEAEDVVNQHGIIQTKDTKETLPNQNLFMEFFSESIHHNKSQQHVRSSQQSHINAIQEEETEQMVDETFMMYLLLKKLSSYIPQIKDLTDSENNPRLKRALNYYKNETASIEIVNMNGKLEKIYFQVPTLMKYLTGETKRQFMEEVERDSINDKINGLLDNMDNFYMEMIHFMKLRKIGIRFNNNFIVYLRNMGIFLALLINILITINDTEEQMANATKAFAIIDLIIYGVIMLTWTFIRMQLEYDRIYKEVSDFIKLNYMKKSNQQQQQQQQNQKTVIYPFSITILQSFLIIKRMLFSSYTFYWFLLLVINLLGLFYNKFFYGLLLLDIIDHSQVLRNVIKSISLNYKQLLMTALLGVLIMYIYSLIAYQSNEFKDQLDYSDNNESSDYLDNVVCYSAFQCLVFVIHQGLRAGGGIGDLRVSGGIGNALSSPTNSNFNYYSQRVFYDLSFFILINIIFLNIIFGIIIDTFAELRDQKNQKDFDSQNRCYICDLTRTIFEKEGISFDNHVQKYHNPWNYLAYLLYLKVKLKTEHTGTESYVYSKFLQNDISWLPIQKALDLELIAEQSKVTIDLNTDDHNQKSLH